MREALMAVWLLAASFGYAAGQNDVSALHPVFKATEERNDATTPGMPHLIVELINLKPLD